MEQTPTGIFQLELKSNVNKASIHLYSHLHSSFILKLFFLFIITSYCHIIITFCCVVELFRLYNLHRNRTRWIDLMKENSLTLKKGNAGETITDTDYIWSGAYPNTPVQAESSLHILRHWSTWFQIRSSSCVLNKMEPSPLTSKPLKSVDHFTCLCSNILSSKNDILTRLRGLGDQLWIVQEV